MIHETIYKFDTRGNLRVWYMEREGSRYRTIAGLADGQLVTSEWTQAEPTNVGRSNERNAEEQAIFEVEAAYQHKLTREYHSTPEKAKGGAHFFKPMLANKYEDFFRGYAQPKLDGVRCIATADGLYSRQGKPITSCPHIEEALRPLFAADPDLIFDGELYNHLLKEDFNEIISLVRKASPKPEQLEEIAAKVQYHIYDLPSLPDTFEQRFYYLEDVLYDLSPDKDCIELVETQTVDTESHYDTLHGQWLEAGYEGSMWRDNKPYEQKRSKTLLKRKEFLDAEFELVRIEEGLGNWSGVAKRAVCRLPDGREFGAGIKGTKERAAKLLHEDHKVVTIKYFQMTPDGIPRFPIATVFHGAERTL